MAVKLIIEKDENEKFPAYTGINDEQGWVDGTTPLNAANLNISETALKAWFGESGHISNLIKQINDEDANVKAELIGATGSTKDSDTIKGAKLYADSVADSKADASALSTLQDNINTNTDNITKLQVYVGDIPEGVHADTVIDYIGLKTHGITTDTSFSELLTKVDTLTSDLDAVEGTLNEQDAIIKSLPEDFTSFIKSGDTIQLVGMNATQILNSNG